MIRIEILEEAASTNSEAALFARTGTKAPVLLAARRQTAGRGQRGNSWEAEPGKNITASLLWFPRAFRASLQFSLSEAVALAVVDMLAGAGIEAKVKWPNDIYVGDRKICGILIEHSVTGMTIDHTVAGVGINVNQRLFLSDAPNPVSMTQLTGNEYDVDRELRRLAESLETRLRQAESEEGRTALHEEFLERMWRYDGKNHPFRDVASGEVYYGIIRGVDGNGVLRIEKSRGGETVGYMFKEVEFLAK